MALQTGKGGMKPVYSIGDFSKITGITIKALRHYHRKDLLVPRHVDSDTGYRYYDADNLEKARGIVYLKELLFPLEEIRDLLSSLEDDTHILDFLLVQRSKIDEKIHELQEVKTSIDEVIARERKVREMLGKSEFEVSERELDAILVAGVRWKGRYSDCGEKFALLYKKMGRLVCGKPMNLYYDEGYMEDDADIETCIPIREARNVEGLTIRQLEGSRALTLIHKGPYDRLGRSYEKMTNHIQTKGYRVKGPSREIYLKSAGMLFKGNPEKYLTEIQFMIA